VLRDGEVLAELEGDPAVTHGQRLPGDLLRALEKAGVALDAVELLAVAAGPGSFTGLRVGIATMQGLAFARSLRIVPVSALDALAQVALEQAPRTPRIAVWIDAHRGEVFSAVYDAAGEPLGSPAALPPGDTLHAWHDLLGTGPVVWTGDGALRYQDTITAALGSRASILAPPPLAAPVGRLAAREPDRAVLPHAVVPIYVRRPDAELARERGRAPEGTPPDRR
jgi:tRNA threonylcarbamoyladenosine biosynthesis protein TsaB